MKAIILAAGFGNRMKPLTDKTHKTLLNVAGNTIIGRIIEGLFDNNIKDIVIVTGYLESELKSYLLSNYSQINFKFIHNERYRETNNIHSLALAINGIEIDDDIILIESDLIYEPSVISRIINSKYPNVALVDKFRSGMDGTVVTINENIVTNIIPPHLQGSNFDFSDKYKTLNIYKFSKEFCGTVFKQLITYYSKVIDDNCYYELILGILIYMQRETIFAEIIDGEKWSEVDDPNDLNVSEFIFNNDKKIEILEKTFGGYWSHNILDFCFIRNMYFPNNSMLSEMKNNLNNLLHNYGSKQDILNQKLAYFLLYKKENLNLLNGASQIFPIFGSYFDNQKILTPSPGFGEYTRIFTNTVFYSDKVGFDLNEIEIKSKECNLIVFVNPNNPTGSIIDTNWIYNFAKNNSTKMIIVDESFIEFSGLKSIIEILENNPLDNIIVVKSLSKSLGVPGVRLGYVYTYNKKFNDYLKKSIPIWNMNSISEYMLEIILKHKKSLNESFKKTIRDREDFIKLLSGLKFVEKVFPSGGNFILVKFKGNIETYKNLTKDLINDCLIYIKDVSNKLNDSNYYIRLAVRLPEENKKLIDCLNNNINTKK